MNDQVSPFMFMASFGFFLDGIIFLIFKNFRDALSFIVMSIVCLLIRIDWRKTYWSEEFISERIENIIEKVVKIIKERKIGKIDWKIITIIGIIIGLTSFCIYVLLQQQQISFTVDYICKYYDENKSRCFCGNVYEDGTFEYMHFGKIVKTDYNTFCCVDTHDSCKVIRE